MSYPTPKYGSHFVLTLYSLCTHFVLTVYSLCTHLKRTKTTFIQYNEQLAHVTEQLTLVTKQMGEQQRLLEQSIIGKRAHTNPELPACSGKGCKRKTHVRSDGKTSKQCTLCRDRQTKYRHTRIS